jgi:hypothetical protein
MWNGRVFHFVFIKNAEMAELVDAPASKAGVLKGRVGSSPTFGTNGDMV